LLAEAKAAAEKHAQLAGGNVAAQHVITMAQQKVKAALAALKSVRASLGPAHQAAQAAYRVHERMRTAHQTAVAKLRKAKASHDRTKATQRAKIATAKADLANAETAFRMAQKNNRDSLTRFVKANGDKAAVRQSRRTAATLAIAESHVTKARKFFAWISSALKRSQGDVGKAQAAVARAAAAVKKALTKMVESKKTLKQAETTHKSAVSRADQAKAKLDKVKSQKIRTDAAYSAHHQKLYKKFLALWMQYAKNVRVQSEKLRKARFLNKQAKKALSSARKEVTAAESAKHKARTFLLKAQRARKFAQKKYNAIAEKQAQEVFNAHMKNDVDTAHNAATLVKDTEAEVHRTEKMALLARKAVALRTKQMNRVHKDWSAIHAKYVAARKAQARARAAMEHSDAMRLVHREQYQVSKKNALKAQRTLARVKKAAKAAKAVLQYATARYEKARAQALVSSLDADESRAQAQKDAANDLANHAHDVSRKHARAKAMQVAAQAARGAMGKARTKLTKLIGRIAKARAAFQAALTTVARAKVKASGDRKVMAKAKARLAQAARRVKNIQRVYDQLKKTARGVWAKHAHAQSDVAHYKMDVKLARAAVKKAMVNVAKARAARVAAEHAVREAAKQYTLLKIQGPPQVSPRKKRTVLTAAAQVKRARVLATRAYKAAAKKVAQQQMVLSQSQRNVVRLKELVKRRFVSSLVHMKRAAHLRAENRIKADEAKEAGIALEKLGFAIENARLAGEKNKLIDVQAKSAMLKSKIARLAKVMAAVSAQIADEDKLALTKTVESKKAKLSIKREVKKIKLAKKAFTASQIAYTKAVKVSHFVDESYAHVQEKVHHLKDAEQAFTYQLAGARRRHESAQQQAVRASARETRARRTVARGQQVVKGYQKEVSVAEKEVARMRKMLKAAMAALKQTGKKLATARAGLKSRKGAFAKAQANYKLTSLVVSHAMAAKLKAMRATRRILKEHRRAEKAVRQALRAYKTAVRASKASRTAAQRARVNQRHAAVAGRKKLAMTLGRIDLSMAHQAKEEELAFSTLKFARGNLAKVEKTLTKKKQGAALAGKLARAAKKALERSSAKYQKLKAKVLRLSKSIGKLQKKHTAATQRLQKLARLAQKDKAFFNGAIKEQRTMKVILQKRRAAAQAAIKRALSLSAHVAAEVVKAEAAALHPEDDHAAPVVVKRKHFDNTLLNDDLDVDATPSKGNHKELDHWAEQQALRIVRALKKKLVKDVRAGGKPHHVVRRIERLVAKHADRMVKTINA